MRRALAAALLLLLPLLAAPALIAQPTTATSPEAGPSQPVPVPQPSDKAMRYYRSGNVLWGIDTLWGLLVPALLLFTGFSARMRNAARKIGGNWFFTVTIYGLLFTLVTFLLDLPLAYYTEFVRQHAYGLSDQA